MSISLRSRWRKPTVGREDVGAQEGNEQFGAGADIVLEPFQDAADRAVEMLCGAQKEDRTEISPIETEEKQTP